MKQISINKESAFKHLKNTKTFHYLNDEELELLYEICKFVRFDSKEIIIKESEVNPNLYVIIKGTVKVMVHENYDKDIYLCSIGEGDVFGEAALFINMKRTADVYAEDNTELIMIDRNSLLTFFKMHPAAGMKILMVMVYSLLLKLRESNQELAFERKTYFNQEEVDQLMKSMYSLDIDGPPK
jgi:CRP/FNR family transcriptional regulator, cyclic AMP receptor protein